MLMAVLMWLRFYQPGDSSIMTVVVLLTRCVQQLMRSVEVQQLAQVVPQLRVALLQEQKVHLHSDPIRKSSDLRSLSRRDVVYIGFEEVDQAPEVLLQILQPLVYWMLKISAFLHL
jgi:hypothetical protein